MVELAPGWSIEGLVDRARETATVVIHGDVALELERRLVIMPARVVP